jgi:hypothetical protein
MESEGTVKRVSEYIESVGYYYAESAEYAYMIHAPSSITIADTPNGAENDGFHNHRLFRLTFKVEPVED